MLKKRDDLPQKKKTKRLDPVERELQEKKQIADAKSKMNKFLVDSNKQIDQYVAKAREAKDKGFIEQAKKLAKRAKLIQAQQTKVEEMVFQFEMGNMMNNMNDMMVDFMDSMSTFAKNLNDNQMKDKHMVKTLAKFQDAQNNLSRQTELMSTFMEESEDSMSDLLEVNDQLSNSELADMLNGTAGQNTVAYEEAKEDMSASLDDVDDILNSLKR